MKLSLDEIRQKYGLNLILLHGSRAVQQMRSDSDTDIAIVRQNRHTALNLLQLYADLSSAMQNDHLDIVDLTHANPLLLKTVTNKAKVLAGSPRHFTELQLKALHEYNDFLPYFKLEQELNQQELAKLHS